MRVSAVLDPIHQLWTLTGGNIVKLRALVNYTIYSVILLTRFQISFFVTSDCGEWELPVNMTSLAS